jgi:hypothetical protein
MRKNPIIHVEWHKASHAILDILDISREKRKAPSPSHMPVRSCTVSSAVIRRAIAAVSQSGSDSDSEHRTFLEELLSRLSLGAGEQDIQ